MPVVVPSEISSFGRSPPAGTTGLAGRLVGEIVKRPLVRCLITVQIFEEVINDFTIVEADFRQLAPADLDDLVDVPRVARIPVIDGRVIGIVGSRPRDDFGAA